MYATNSRRKDSTFPGLLLQWLPYTKFLLVWPTGRPQKSSAKERTTVRCTTAGLRCRTNRRSRPLEEGSNEEGLGAAQDGPDKVGTAHRDGLPVPTSGVTSAPSAGKADRRDLQSCDRSGPPGPSPGWGTTPNRNQVDD